MSTSLHQHALNNNITLPHGIEWDNGIIRFNDPNMRGGAKDWWYVAHDYGDHKQVCYGTWKNGLTSYDWHTWDTDQDIDHELREKMRQAVVRQQEFQQEEWDKAAVLAKKIWEEAKPAVTHPYLIRKKIKPHHFRIWGYNGTRNILVSPVLDPETDEIISVQMIFEDGTKRFLRGSKARGYYLFGQFNPKEACKIGEGLATCATVYEVKGCPTVCAYGSHNCNSIAFHLMERGLARSCDLLKDIGEAGDKIEKEWTQNDHGTVYAPLIKSEEGTDFNDLFVARGPAAVIQSLQPKVLPTITLHDLMSMDIPDMEWIVGNVFYKGSVNVTYAPPGVGKSMYALDQALCLANGWSMFNGWNTEKQKVLYVDGEMSPVLFKKRVQMAGARWKACGWHNDPSAVFNMHPVLLLQEQYSETFDLYTTKTRNMLDELVDKTDVVVFDNWGCLTQRDGSADFRADEASWSEAFRWMQGWIAKGKTFFILMHTNKSNSLAGSALILNKVDSALRLQKLHEDFRTVPDTLGFVANWTKSRGVEPQHAKPFAAQMLTARMCKDENRRSPWELIDEENMPDIKKADLGKNSLDNFTTSPF